MKWKRINKSDRKRNKLLAYRLSEMGRITGEMLDNFIFKMMAKESVLTSESRRGQKTGRTVKFRRIAKEEGQKSEGR